MYIVDLDKKSVHDMSKPAYECQITKIPKDRRKKLFTVDGMKRFLEDPKNKAFQGCKFCMPEFYTYDMQAIFRNQ